MPENVSTNEAVDYLAGLMELCVMDPANWKAFGYRARPRHGALWRKIFPRRKMEDFLRKEFLVMSFTDMVMALRRSPISHGSAALVLAGILDRCLSMARPWIGHQDLMVILKEGFAGYFSIGHDQYVPVFTARAEKSVAKRDLKRIRAGAAIVPGYHIGKGLILNRGLLLEWISERTFTGDPILRSAKWPAAALLEQAGDFLARN